VLDDDCLVKRVKLALIVHFGQFEGNCRLLLRELKFGSDQSAWRCRSQQVCCCLNLADDKFSTSTFELIKPIMD